MRSNRRGIEPAEVAVVIGIIVILFAILAPVFVRARLYARVVAASTGEYTSTDREVQTFRGDSHFEQYIRQYPSLLERYPGFRVAGSAAALPTATASDLAGPTMTRTLRVTLMNGQSVTAVITLPAGSEVSTITVMPDVVESPPSP